jgi:hypothetical protein
MLLDALINLRVRETGGKILKLNRARVLSPDLAL